MGKYICTHCKQEISSLFHKCGVKETPIKVEIHSGGGWGRIDLGGRNEHNDIK